jgi:hypothetical protein
MFAVLGLWRREPKLRIQNAMERKVALAPISVFPLYTNHILRFPFK